VDHSQCTPRRQRTHPESRLNLLGPRRRAGRVSSPAHGGLRTFHRKSTCLHTINLRASSDANLSTPPPTFWRDETFIVRRVDPHPLSRPSSRPPSRSYRGTSLIKKRPPPKDHQAQALCRVLGEGSFLRAPVSRSRPCCRSRTLKRSHTPQIGRAYLTRHLCTHPLPSRMQGTPVCVFYNTYRTCLV